VSFNGSDLTNAVFSNAILTNARFGRDADGRWANLAGRLTRGWV
jgi:uncharacterized protein YjbI with pentapeptide repeats